MLQSHIGKYLDSMIDTGHHPLINKGSNTFNRRDTSSVHVIIINFLNR